MMGTTIIPAGDVLIVQQTQEPQTSFTYKFKTKLGQTLEITLSDSNIADATKMRDDMIMQFGLELIKDEDDDTPYFMLPLYAGVATLALGIVVVVLGAILNIGDFISFDTAEWILSMTARWGLIAVWPGLTALLIVSKFFVNRAGKTF
jgi:hypothetical protein